MVRVDDTFAITKGLLQDWNGRWIVGFSRYLGKCAILDFKLWSIFDGLKLILDRGVDRVLIQTGKSWSSQHHSRENKWSFQLCSGKENTFFVEALEVMEYTTYSPRRKQTCRQDS